MPPPRARRTDLLAALALAALLGCAPDSPSSHPGDAGQADVQADGAGDEEAGDVTSPVVNITSPAQSDTFEYTLTGTAGDDTDIQALSYTVSGDDPVDLEPAASFEVTLTLPASTTTIRVLARDPAGNLGVDEVTVVVTPVNRPPTAAGASLSLLEDEPLEINLNVDDPDGDDLTVDVTQLPLHGTLDLSAAPFVVYTPAPDYHGADGFTFTASDGALQSSAATYSLTISPVNDAPVAEPAEVGIDEDAPTAIVLQASDADGDLLSYAVIEPPEHAQLTAGALRTYLYTPAANYFGPDAFVFEVGDGEHTSRATVSITVSAVNDPPTIVVPASPLTTEEDLAVQFRLDGADVETPEDALTFELVDLAGFGTVTIVSDLVTYQPLPNAFGEDEFSLAAHDGEALGAALPVTIIVTPLNDAPVAVDTTLQTREDTPLDVVLEATDVETPSSNLLFELLSSPDATAGLLEGSPPNLRFVPARDFHGETAFTYSVTDGEASDTATVTLIVLEGTIYYVSRTDGSDDNSGLHPDTPLRTIGAAIGLADFAAPDELPDRIEVGPGRYCEQGLAVDRPLDVRGSGMDETIVDASNTALDCTPPALGACISRAHTGPVLHVADTDSERFDASVRDLTLAHATNVNGQGGGIYNEEALSLERVRLTDNCAADGGGLANVYLSRDAWGTVDAIDCEITTNAAYAGRVGQGGGIYNAGAVRLEGTLVADNALDALGPGALGGGIASVGVDTDPGSGALTLVESVVTGNAGEGGGGIRAEGADVELRDSLVADNLATEGGGVQVLADARIPALTLVRSRIAYNTAVFGGGLHVFWGVAVTLEDSAIEANRAEHGGGAYLDTVLEMDGLVVRGNHASNSGGGVFVETTRLDGCTLADFELYDNSADLGGGLVTTGIMHLSGLVVSGNRAVYEGGGLFTGFGEVHLEDAWFDANRAEPTADDCIPDEPPCRPFSYQNQQLGGGMAVRNATLVLTDTDLTANRSADGGGALALVGATAFIDGGTLSGNRAEAGANPDELSDGFGGSGGAIYMASEGYAEMGHIELTDNVAGELGGAVYAHRADFALGASTLVANLAGSDTADGRGGAVYIFNGTGLMALGTFEGNRATGLGAAFYMDEDVLSGNTLLECLHCTVTANGAAGEAPAAMQGHEVLDTIGSIFAHNVPANCDVFDPVSSDGQNLDSDGTCQLAEDDITGLDPLLEPLGDWGGPTRTRRPQPDSPVIDAAAEVCAGGDTDQRGVARPVDGDEVDGARCDIGSVEYP